jgi:hypothetical protein
MLMNMKIIVIEKFGTGCIISDHSSLDIADEETGWYDGQVFVFTLCCFFTNEIFSQREQGLSLNYVYFLLLSLNIFLQIWVKTPEVLARDRLLGSFSVSILFNCCFTSISNFNVAGDFC